VCGFNDDFTIVLIFLLVLLVLEEGIHTEYNAYLQLEVQASCEVMFKWSYKATSEDVWKQISLPVRSINL